jgi:fatty-acyl-CoA synthase
VRGFRKAEAKGFVDRYSSLLRVLADHAAQTPLTPALSDARDSLSFAQLWRYVDAVPAWLESHDIGAGDPVAIALAPGVAFLALLLGVMAAGAIAVPLNVRLTPGELDQYLLSIGAKAVFTDSIDFRGMDATAATPVWEVDRALPASVSLGFLGGHGMDVESAAWNYRLPVAASAPAIVFGTGGTTGTPKAAAWSHAGLWSYASSCALAMEVRRTDVELFFSPVSHIALATGPFATLFAGGSCHFLPEFNAGDVAELLALGGITRLYGAPTALERLISSPEFDASKMNAVRRILFGSSRSAPDLPDRLSRAFPAAEFITGYGATEFGAVIRLRSWEMRGVTDMGVGKPVPGATIRVVDSCGQRVPRGTTGEIVVDAPWRMLGYWNRKDETDAVSGEAGIRSGDLGWIDASGNIHLSGRLKEMIITGGENVFPAEVENVLSSHPDVAEAAVIGVHDDEWGERVVAVLVPLPGRQPTHEQLRRYSRERLAGFKVPKKFHLVPQLPITPAMKVDKRTIEEWVMRSPTTSGAE